MNDTNIIQSLRGLRKFKPYSAYKDSGVEWLGDIPAHWELKKIRRITQSHKQGFYTEQAYIDDGVKLARITDIDDFGRVSFDEMPFVEIPAREERLFKLEEGDVLFARSGTIGRFGIVRKPDRSVFASYLIRFRFASVESEFLLFALSSHFFKESLLSTLHGGANQNVHAENIKEQLIALPPTFEQRAIAAFLDRETTKIDALVTKKERLIELLQEKRTALITRAVTKGLDPNVSMKDSGVKWLVEIPAHWRVVRTKYILKDRISGPFGSSLTKESYGGNRYRVYGQEQVIPGNFTVGDYYIPEEKFRAMARYAVAPGDVLLSCVGTFGRTAVVPEGIEPGIINPRLILLRPNLGVILPDYLELFLKSDLAYSEMDEITRGGTMDIINLSTMSALVMPLPPLEDQNQILATVRENNSNIDKLLLRIRGAIDRLKELRTALISAAVTGKIDVREEAA